MFFQNPGNEIELNGHLFILFLTHLDDNETSHGTEDVLATLTNSGKGDG
jgi:hypothetical protein